MSDAPPSSPAAGGPLSAEHKEQIAEAAARLRKIKGAVKLANFNGYTTAIIAACCAVGLAFGPDLTNVLITIALSYVAFTEFRGRTMFQNLDVRAGRTLGANQLVFLGLITIYCLWSIYQAYFAPMPSSGDASVDNLMKDYEPTVRSILVLVYTLVIVLSVVFQGLCARSYFIAGRRLREYVEQTPDWIVQLQRPGLGQ
ncbi:MAG: hypothetical protein GC162_04900 [Planctomycetes bacterium]|nr:hypothetical protein [Planctomycetota bacterium]